MNWRYINTGAQNGAFNMKFDEKLAMDALKDDSLPTLRLYRWSPFAISIGRHQNENVFDALELQSKGIDLVRRPTGGRAIFHAHELTYSVATRTEMMSPRELYRFVNQGLLAGLKLLGIEAELAATTDDFRTLYSLPESVPCFSSTAKSEIQFQGKKLVGSAQRRFGDVILQHGSLLLSDEHKHIADFLAPHLIRERETIEEHIESRTTEAETILGTHISFEEAAQAVREGCAQAWNASFSQEDYLTPTIEAAYYED